MATVAERLERALEREAPSWGVRPVPPQHRRLSGFDFGVLWGDLSIGLLVLLTGALLVPALGLPEAVGAIVVGTLLGAIPLALVGYAAAREGVPGMVLFRPVLGRRGSYMPTILNMVQLVGWTGFELWAMAQVANRMSLRLFGFSSYPLWLGVVAAICTVLALGGPILVVRQWLEKFAAWVTAAVGLWVTIRLLSTVDLAAIWNAPGRGGYPSGFWLAVDLVIAMPVSWLPLVADYNRFARSPRASAAGTYAGYAAGNLWFYLLGALLVLGAGLPDASPAGLGQSMASLAGAWLILLLVFAGETHNGFADIYSAAISSLNLNERFNQRAAVLVVAALGTALAASLGGRPASGVGDFESFLYLLGSVFVPLFGVFVADYYALRRRDHREEELFGPSDRAGVRWGAVVAWAFGFLIYQWSVPTGPAAWQTAVGTVFHAWLRLPFPLAGSASGASLPAFAAAFLLHWALSRLGGGLGGASRRPG